MRPRKPLGFGEKCVRDYSLKSIACARGVIAVLGDLADDVVDGKARKQLEEINNGFFDAAEPLDVSNYYFLVDLTDPLEVAFIERRKKFAKIGPTRVPPPSMEPPILKPKETEKRVDRLARERAVFKEEERKTNIYKKRRYDMVRLLLLLLLLLLFVLDLSLKII